MKDLHMSYRKETKNKKTQKLTGTIADYPLVEVKHNHVEKALTFSLRLLMPSQRYCF